MPMVSNCPTACATSALVPTPSVDETRTGFLNRCWGKANSPPKPPMSPMTSGRYVERTSSLMASTASSPAVMSTPASLYDSPISDPSAVRGEQRRLVQRALELAGRHRVALEHFLAQGHGHRNGVVPGEARVAEPGADRAGRLVQPVDTEVGEAVGPDVLLDLLDVELRREQLAPVPGVDAVVAGPLDRRRGDPQMDLNGARLAQHLDQLAL